MTTDVFNHGPAKLFMNTGFHAPGRPAMGAWVTYGLGSESRDLPGFVVLQSGPRGPRAGRRCGPAAFCPPRSRACRSAARATRSSTSAARRESTRDTERDFYDTVGALNRSRLDRHRRRGDPHADQRLRDGLPHADQRPGAHGPVAGIRRRSISTAPSPASRRMPRNCLLARRLVERGVRFVQLYHTDWDHHGDTEQPGRGARGPLPRNRPGQRRPGEGPQAARPARTTRSSSGAANSAARRWARSATPSAATTTSTPSPCGWPAAASSPGTHPSARPTSSASASSRTSVHVHDLHATILHLLGFDHERSPTASRAATSA
jgi:hypothetical protein